MRLRITDYFYSSANHATWERLETWATSLGFEVVRDHGSAQIGVSCGIVAARVLTWLKYGQEDFMIQDTTSAASPAVLRQGNEVLCSTAIPGDEGFMLPHAGALIPTHAPREWCAKAWPSMQARADSSVTQFLSETACAFVTDNFNGGAPSSTHSGGYISWPSLDELVFMI